MAGSPSPLTTHVLNTGMGIPASNMAVNLYRLDPSTNAWSLIKSGYSHCQSSICNCGKISATYNVYSCCHMYFCLNRTTNEDGRCPGLITPQMFTSSVYKLHFETSQYWESMGQTSFYPYVEVRLHSVTHWHHNSYSFYSIINNSLYVVVSWILQIVFTINDPGQKYHIPLLLSRFSYSTYRGS